MSNDSGSENAAIEHVRELLDGQPNTFEPEILDHLEFIEENGFQYPSDHVPEPDTPRELVYWDLGLVVGYYQALEETNE